MKYARHILMWKEVLVGGMNKKLRYMEEELSMREFREDSLEEIIHKLKFEEA